MLDYEGHMRRVSVMRAILGTTLLGLTSLMGCGGTEPVDDDITTDTVVTTELSPGVYSTVVDASDISAFVYFAFSKPGQVKPADPAASTEWDLGLRRFSIKVNGGVSGSQAMLVAAITDQDFAAVTKAPSSGYATDEAREGMSSNPDFIGGDEAAFVFFAPNPASENGWYLYDEPTHSLSPAPIVYVLRAADGTSFYKLQITKYYNQAGEAGHVEFIWSAVEGPGVPIEGEEQPKPKPGLRVDTNASWTYLTLEGATVEISGAKTSMDWDLAIWRTMWKTNSGGSGPGKGGARWASEGSSFMDLASAPTIGYEPDRELPVPGPPGAGTFDGSPALNEWYDYEPTTHAVSPKARVLFVRGADGEHAKLVIHEYEEGLYRFELTKLEADPEVASVTINSTENDWSYFNLRTGMSVEPFDPSASTDWDLGVSGSRVRTNGGTSGPGQGGARAMGTSDLASVATAPAEGYTVDAVLTSSTGAELGSSNAVLATWVAGEVFAVRLADGTFVKLAVTGASEGVHEIDYAYAGPGRRGF